MDNQNSTEQEKKKGFNLRGNRRRVIIISIAILLLFGFIARGAGMRGAIGWGNMNRSNRGLGDRSSALMGTRNTVAARDFEPLGIVFAESTASNRNGYGVTYEILMREAAQKGADAIINVSISPTSGVFNRTWSGSALAIKYQD